MQVFAEGRWESSAGRIVTEGIGWKPSSEAGRAGEPGTRSRRIKIRPFNKALTFKNSRGKKKSKRIKLYSKRNYVKSHRNLRSR